MVDTSTDAVVATIPIPPTPCEWECWTAPLGITDLVIAGDRVYVSQQWVGDSYYTGTLTMIDTATNSVIAEGGGEWHTDLEVSSDGRRIYAGVGDYRYVREFDAQTMAGVGTVVVTGPYWPVVTSVNLSPDDKRGYAVVAPDMYATAAQVTVIDTDPESANYNKPIANITVPAGARYVEVSPDGSRAYVVHDGGKIVTVIDTGTNTVIGTITSDQIGGDYAALALGPRRHALLFELRARQRLRGHGGRHDVAALSAYKPAGSDRPATIARITDGPPVCALAAASAVRSSVTELAVATRVTPSDCANTSKFQSGSTL